MYIPRGIKGTALTLQEELLGERKVSLLLRTLLLRFSSRPLLASFFPCLSFFFGVLSESAIPREPERR